MAYQQASGTADAAKSQHGLSKASIPSAGVVKDKLGPLDGTPHAKAISDQNDTDKDLEKIDSSVSERITLMSKSLSERMKNNLTSKIWDLNTYYDLSMRLVEAESQGGHDKEKTIQAYKNHLDRMMSLFDYYYKKNIETDFESMDDVFNILEFIRDAEIAIENSKIGNSSQMNASNLNPNDKKKQDSTSSGAAIDAKKNEKPTKPPFPSMRDERKKPINKAIFAALDRPIPMPFPNDTPIEEVLNYVRKASAQEPGGKPLPIYVDPKGLQAADKTMASCVTIDLEGVPLRVTLDFVLNQLEMCYFVKSGVIFVSSKDAEDLSRIDDPDGPYADPDE
jgi:hypothetical protein